jgi:hypothetical protein
VYIFRTSGFHSRREWGIISRVETFEENFKGLLDNGINVERKDDRPEGYPVFEVFQREISFE